LDISLELTCGLYYSLYRSNALYINYSMFSSAYSNFLINRVYPNPP
jgi:hypothetical protein